MTESFAAPRASALHGNAILVGESGILLLGGAGRGKSSLCLALLSAAAISRQFVVLIADDRVWLTRSGDKLIARPTRRFEGLIERRGEGIISVPHEPAAVVRLVVELLAEDHPQVRAPDESAQLFEHSGIVVPKFFVDLKAGAVAGALAILHRLVRDTKLDAGGIANFA